MLLRKLNGHIGIKIGALDSELRGHRQIHYGLKLIYLLENQYIGLNITEPITGSHE